MMRMETGWESWSIDGARVDRRRLPLCRIGAGNGHGRKEQRMKSLGEPLTISEIEAEPIPGRDNFAAAPIFAELFGTPETKIGDCRRSKVFVGREATPIRC